jgi:hypothetical protein
MHVAGHYGLRKRRVCTLKMSPLIIRIKVRGQVRTACNSNEIEFSIKAKRGEILSCSLICPYFLYNWIIPCLPEYIIVIQAKLNILILSGSVFHAAASSYNAAPTSDKKITAAAQLATATARLQLPAMRDSVRVSRIQYRCSHILYTLGSK